MKYGEQQRIFRKIHGLENAEFARFGGIHRNTFINSPQLLDEFGRFKKFPNIYFAGQITGVEGYVESASMGLITGIFIANQINNSAKKLSRPSNETAIGSLLNHIAPDSEQMKVTQENSFQPMNINFGLFAPLENNIAKDARKEAYSTRALEQLEIFKIENGIN
jgi:methylenetetrahydrofolate--tRNA-(uracil-5-)-methyltransferase